MSELSELQYPSKEVNSSVLNTDNVALQELCNKLLTQTIRDSAKMAARTKYLDQNPRARISIDTIKIKQIINYDSFKCHPQCSIARGQAINGSDIDGALVVLREETSIDQQLAFVTELRNQGFAASHATEVAAAKKAIEEAKQNGIDVTSSEFNELIHQENLLYQAEVKFHTKDELESMKTENHSEFPLLYTDPLVMYVAGYPVVDAHQ